jgi:hypothetical protein
VKKKCNFPEVLSTYLKGRCSSPKYDPQPYMEGPFTSEVFLTYKSFPTQLLTCGVDLSNDTHSEDICACAPWLDLYQDLYLWYYIDLYS